MLSKKAPREDNKLVQQYILITTRVPHYDFAFSFIVIIVAYFYSGSKLPAMFSFSVNGTMYHVLLC